MATLAKRLSLTIRQLRLAQGMSQERFAAHAGVHRTQMGKLEGIKETNPQLDTLEKVARGLQISVSELIRRAEMLEGLPPDVEPAAPPTIRLVAEPGSENTGTA